MKKILLLSTISLAMLMAGNVPGQKHHHHSAKNKPVNTSGIIHNSVDLIWEDMHGETDVCPVATGSMGQTRGPVFRGAIHTKNLELWTRSNAWYEVEEDAGKGNYCSLSINEAINVNVEVGRIMGAWLDTSGIWHVLTDSIIDGFRGKQNPRNTLFASSRACSTAVAAEFDQLRQKYYDYEVLKGQTAEGHPIVDPKYAWRYHGWSHQAGPIDKPTIKAIFVSAYARLVLKDPNGVNDMDKARYIIHVSSDKKKDDGTSCMHKDADGNWIDCGWGVAGISRYKLIPQNGDWMPVNFLDGFITKEELDANPPPFPKHP